MSRKRAFGCGVLSGAVEPMAAFVTICATSLIVPLLPYLLSFAAGAMLYVVVAELIPELLIINAEEKVQSDIGILFFAVGFSIMMVLDVVMG